jgi:hypothetical protein
MEGGKIRNVFVLGGTIRSSEHKALSTSWSCWFFMYVLHQVMKGTPHTGKGSKPDSSRRVEFLNKVDRKEQVWSLRNSQGTSWCCHV